MDNFTVHYSIVSKHTGKKSFSFIWVKADNCEQAEAEFRKWYSECDNAEVPEIVATIKQNCEVL